MHTQHVCFQTRAHKSRFFIYWTETNVAERVDLKSHHKVCVWCAYTHRHRFARVPEKGGRRARTKKTNDRYGGRDIEQWRHWVTVAAWRRKEGCAGASGHVSSDKHFVTFKILILKILVSYLSVTTIKLISNYLNNWVL